MGFTKLPRRSGRISYRDRQTGTLWGSEDFSITRDAAGGRTQIAHCELAFGEDRVVRDSVLTVDAAFQPVDAFVRILNHGVQSGAGWFRFGETEAEFEGFTAAEGRVAQRLPITRPMRGFGIHALVGDGWLAATFPYAKGPGTSHYFGQNLLHSLHHFGATGPSLEVSTSGLKYEAREVVTVPAGSFDCYRLSFAGMTNAHPPYTMWISADGDFLYIKGIAGGYMDAVFELKELTGEWQA